MKKPNWSYWCKQERVALWRAVTLSLNIDPDDLATNYRQFSAFCDSNGNARQRLSDVANNLRWPNYFSVSPSQPSEQVADTIVWLAEFAAFGHCEMQWANLPPELVAIAQAPNIFASKLADSKPQSEAAAPNQVRTISTSNPKRSNLLAAVIEAAKSKSPNPADCHSVWAELVKLAESQNRPAPLLGFVEAEGVKYQGDDNVKFFTKRNLSDRMRRAKQR